jgi:hypothetical protein
MPKKLPAPADHLPVTVELIERKIYLIRDHRVMLDRDLAELYGVTARALRQQVKRNKKRFPPDFLFQLTKKEAEFLVSQTVTPSQRYSFGGFLPYAFTEQGVAMLSSVLTSDRAVSVNIAIMRVFVQLRQLAGTHKELAEKLAAMEKKYDSQFAVVFKAIKQLLSPPQPPKRRRIGFYDRGEDEKK